MRLLSADRDRLLRDLERLYEWAPAAVVVESQGLMIHANPAAAHLLNLPQADPGGRRQLGAFFHTDSRPILDSALRRLADGSRSNATGEATLVPRERGLRDVEFTAWAIPDSEFVVIAFLEVGKLKRQTRRFQTALDHSPVGVFELDRDLRYTWAYYPLAAIDTSALLGRTDEELLGPQQFRKVNEVRRAVLETGVGSRTDFSLEVGGVTRSYDATIEPLRDGDGGVTGLSIVIVDITERKAAEEALLEREGNANRFIEVSPFGMSGRTMDGRIEFANNAFLQMIGATRLDLSSGAVFWNHIVPPDCAGTENSAAAEVERKGFAGPYQTEYLRMDGSRVPVLVSHAIFFSRGVKGVVAFCVDLTDLKRAEAQAIKLSLELEVRNEELAWNNRQLEEISRRKTQFLTSMSHELRTPLNGMIGFLDLLAEEDEAGPLNDRQRLFLLRSRTSCQHLLKLVTDLLDLTRIEAGRMELSLETVPVAEAVAEVLTGIESMAAAKRLTIDTGISADLLARVDRVRFCQIFYNLLTNAVKYTPAGGRVKIQAFGEGTTLFAAVCDTGVGIADEDQHSVFDHFYQARPRDPQSGSGLGLAITRKLVELHGGAIGVKSAVGEGSCFIFTLPGAVVLNQWTM